jgi:hypothetical protein
LRRALGIYVIVLASLLLGALAAGTPVAGNDTVAATTAGIELGTAPVARAVQSAVAPHRLPLARALAIVLQIALVGAALWPLVEVPPDAQSRLRLLCSGARTRRGPPALA